jgi:hypothetical protein
MPRKKTELNQIVLQMLKNKILERSELVLQRSIDCDVLAEMVSKETKVYINGITFKRLFGFTKYPFNPSIQTLNILSRYVGYLNWSNLEQSLVGEKLISKSEFEIYYSFYDLDSINEIEPHEGAFQSVSRKIAQRFREDPNALIRNIDLLMQKPHFQVFFVEHFPDYDNLCNYYFKVYESFLTFNKSTEAQLFGSCMLFLKSFWVLDQESCHRYIEVISKIQINSEFHPYLIGRYYASNILFHTFYGDSGLVEKYIDSYLKIRDIIPKNGKHFKDFPASEYIISEALLHCGRYTEILRLLEKITSEFSIKKEFVRKGYYRQLQLIYSIASKKLKLKSNFADRIDPNDFYFISQDYYKVLFLSARMSGNDWDEAIRLCRKMGNKYLEFVYLQTCL